LGPSGTKVKICALGIDVRISSSANKFDIRFKEINRTFDTGNPCGETDCDRIQQPVFVRTAVNERARSNELQTLDFRSKDLTWDSGVVATEDGDFRGEYTVRVALNFSSVLDSESSTYKSNLDSQHCHSQDRVRRYKVSKAPFRSSLRN
jgi:hypothetical protein